MIGALGMQTLLGVPLLTFLLIHWTLASACDLLVLHAVNRKPSPLAPVLWVIRELLAIPLWIHIAMGDTVLWRGHRLRVLPGGIVENAET